MSARIWATEVFTDPTASPTGFPFKVLQLQRTLSESQVYEARERVCDLGFLRSAYRKPNGSIGYRCPSEPEEHYVMKGGNAADAKDRKCLCNGLLGTIGLGQVVADGETEPAIVTSGDDVAQIARLVKPPRNSYSAADVVRYVLATEKIASAL
jgi:nitronate monooxygenase